MCIKFFWSRTTDIYSLRLQVLADYRKHITWLKSKRLSRTNYIKNYNRIIRIPLKLWPSFLFWLVGNFHRPITKLHGLASSWNILLVYRLQLHRPPLILYTFWFLSSRQPFLHSITFLDTCQKTVSTLTLTLTLTCMAGSAWARGRGGGGRGGSSPHRRGGGGAAVTPEISN